MKIKITIYELDSKKRERITDVKTFENRIDAQNYLDNIQATPKPYKIMDSKRYYDYSAV